MKRVADRSVKFGTHRGTARYFAIAIAALALLFVISFSVGRYPVSVNELLRDSGWRQNHSEVLACERWKPVGISQDSDHAGRPRNPNLRR